MKDSSLVGRMVEFREPLTLSESYSKHGGAIVIHGKIKKVYRKEGQLFAEAESVFERSLEIDCHDTNPNPDWTYEQYCRRKHHKTIYYIKKYGVKSGWVKSEPKIYTIKQSKNKWKPIKQIKHTSDYNPRNEQYNRDLKEWANKETLYEKLVGTFLKIKYI
jgi:transcriptional/translational regulatory protein YebC/TACO1